MSSRHQPVTIYHKMQILPGLTGLYLHVLLRDIARGLESVFVPLYVYKITGSPALPFLFYGFYHLMVILNAWWVPVIVSRIGIDWSALVGAVLRAGSLIMFIKAGSSPAWLWPAFALWGLLIIFTWVPHHYAIIKSVEQDQKVGQKSSIILIIQRLAAALTPLIGGLIVLWLGFDRLYLASIVMILISAVPMFFDRIEKKDMRFAMSRIIKDIQNPAYRRINLALIGEGWEDGATLVLWPLFMYLYIGQIYQVGVITSVALAASLLALYWLGKHSDHKGEGWSGWLFGVLAAIWLVRPFFHHLAGFILIDTIYYIAAALVFLAYNASLYSQAITKHRLEFLVRREILYHGAALVACGLMAFSLGIGLWLTGFVLAAIGALWMKKAVFSQPD